MRTVIDAGNTNVKVGWFQHDKMLRKASFKSHPTSEWYKALGPEQLGQCLVSSVINIPEHLLHYLRSKSIKLLLLDQSLKLPFTNKYHTSATLGKDRIALAAAAVASYPDANVLVISAGTCITYNFITAKKEFLGGAISPGLYMRLEAMHSGTAALPLVAVDGETPLIGYDTDTSLRAGAVNGMIFEIEGYIAALEKEYKNIMVILCGGDSPYIGNKINFSIEVLPDFGLAGLHKILDLNVNTHTQH